MRLNEVSYNTGKKKLRDIFGRRQNKHFKTPRLVTKKVSLQKKVSNQRECIILHNVLQMYSKIRKSLASSAPL